MCHKSCISLKKIFLLKFCRRFADHSLPLVWLDHLGWWSKPWMEKEGGAEYWGFMSPFGNRFVRYICLLALHEPLFQSLLLLVTKLKVELTIKTKAPNSISICKTKKWSLFLPKWKPLLCFFLLEDGEINQLLCGIFLLCEIGCWCRCPLQDGKINQLLSNFVLFWNRTINFHTHNKELALEYHQKWFSRLKEKTCSPIFQLKAGN